MIERPKRAQVLTGETFRLAVTRHADQIDLTVLMIETGAEFVLRLELARAAEMVNRLSCAIEDED